MNPYQDLDTSRMVSNLAIFTTKKIGKKLHVTAYVDVTTGEVISADVAMKMGVRSIRSDAKARREKKLNSLRGGPREFADFLLKFRNNRCGLLIPLDTVISWYSKLTGKQSQHIRRYLTSLVKAEVLDFDYMLNKDFMIINPHTDKESAKGDTFKAYNVFDSMLLKRNPFDQSQLGKCPPWKPTVNGAPSLAEVQ